MITALVLCGQSVSMCCSIRYGFLADAFSRREVSGKVYGMVEGSIFIGYAFIFLLGGTEFLLKKMNSRYLLALITGAFAVSALATGIIFQMEANLPVIVLSMVVRITQGMLAYASSLVAVDCISAHLSREFDFVNGLFNMGIYIGHGIAESVGCVLYENFGYLAPFIFAASFTLVVTVVILQTIPKAKTYLASQDAVDTATDKLVNPSNKLTKLLILPLVATMLINANYGVLQVGLHLNLTPRFV